MARAKRRRSRRRMTAKQRRYFGPRRNAPKRRRRRVTVLRRHRTYRTNPRHRRYHRNVPAIRSIAGDLGWAGAGFMTTKVVGNFVTPMLGGIVGDQPIMRIAVKLGVAYIAAWGLSSFMGARVFTPAMIGGAMGAVQDAVTTFIAPTFPMLADYGGMGIYVEAPRMQMPAVRGRRGMGEYYHMGDGLSPDHDSVV